MARWAKSLNQKKDYTRVPSMNEAGFMTGVQNGSTSAASADIGFAVLEKKVTSPVLMTSQPIIQTPQKAESTILAKVYQIILITEIFY